MPPPWGFPAPSTKVTAMTSPRRGTRHVVDDVGGEGRHPLHSLPIDELPVVLRPVVFGVGVGEEHENRDVCAIKGGMVGGPEAVGDGCQNEGLRLGLVQLLQTGRAILQPFPFRRR